MKRVPKNATTFFDTVGDPTTDTVPARIGNRKGPSPKLPKFPPKFFNAYKVKSEDQVNNKTYEFTINCDEPPQYYYKAEFSEEKLRTENKYFAVREITMYNGAKKPGKHFWLEIHGRRQNYYVIENGIQMPLTHLTFVSECGDPIKTRIQKEVFSHLKHQTYKPGSQRYRKAREEFQKNQISERVKVAKPKVEAKKRALDAKKKVAQQKALKKRIQDAKAKKIAKGKKIAKQATPTLWQSIKSYFSQ